MSFFIHQRALIRFGALVSAIAFSGLAELPSNVQFERFYDHAAISFDQPTFVGGHPEDPSHLIVVERAGGVFRLAKNGTEYERKEWFRLDANVATHWDGAWAVEFHPDFQANRLFYVLYRRKDLDTRSLIEEWTVDSDGVSNPAKVRTVIEFKQKNIHSSGDMHFGPDGYLYSSQADRQIDAQDMKELYGKVIRIDVDNRDPGLQYAIPRDNPYYGRSDVRPEIWASGLRVPWRFSFDPLNGDMLLGDVGDVKSDEVNLIKKGLNYGAGIVEGNCTAGDCSAIVNPILALRRDQSQCVIGGWVYRADPSSRFYGVYIFADYQLQKVFGLRLNAGKTGVEEFGVISASSIPGSISALGHDGAGGYYVAMYRELGAVAERKTQIWRLKHPELRPGPTTGIGGRKAAGLSTRSFSPDRTYSLDGKRKGIGAPALQGEGRNLLIIRDSRTGQTRKWIDLP